MTTARQPWKVTLTCSDCGKTFNIEEKYVNPSTDVIMGGPEQTQRQRLLLVKFLADCPACHTDTGYGMITPADKKRCQAEVPNGPFSLGGEIGDPNNPYRVPDTTQCLCLRGEPCSETCPCVFPQYKSICTRCAPQPPTERQT